MLKIKQVAHISFDAFRSPIYLRRKPENREAKASAIPQIIPFISFLPGKVTIKYRVNHEIIPVKVTIIVKRKNVNCYYFVLIY